MADLYTRLSQIPISVRRSKLALNSRFAKLSESGQKAIINFADQKVCELYKAANKPNFRTITPFVPSIPYNPIPYDEEAVWNDAIWVEGFKLTSDGTNAWTIEPNKVVKINILGEITKYDNGIEYGSDVQYANGYVWTMGFDESFNNKLSKVNVNTGECTLYDYPEGSLQPCCLGSDNSSLWVFIRNNNSERLQIYKVNNNGIFTLYKTADFDSCPNDSVWDRGSMYFIDYTHLYKITPEGIITKSEELYISNCITENNNYIYLTGGEYVIKHLKSDLSFVMNKKLSYGVSSMTTDKNNIWMSLFAQAEDRVIIAAMRKNDSLKEYTKLLPSLSPPLYYASYGILYTNSKLFVTYSEVFNV